MTQGFSQSSEDSDTPFNVEVKEESKDTVKEDKEAPDETRVIVVTADRVKKKKTDIPLSTSVVNEKEIEENMFTSLVDLLDTTPSFTQMFEHHSPLLLRGMSGNRIIILKDGNRRMGSMWKGLRGHNVNVYGIERVEVVRGPGSVIYGSGATCGIINIISKDIFKDEGVNIRLGGAYGSNNNERVGFSSFHWNTGDFAMQLSGRYRKADNYYYGEGEEAENSFIEDKDVSGSVGYRLNNNNRIVVSTDLHYGGPWGKPEGFNGKLVRINNENDNTYHFSLKYEGENVGIFKKLLASGYYDYETRDLHKRKLTAIGNVTKHTIVNYEDKYGGGYLLGVIELGSHNLSVGGDGYAFRLWSPEKWIDYGASIPAWNEKEGMQNSGITSGGLFIQNSWDISKSFTLIGGMRYDTAKVEEGDNPSGQKELLGESDTSKKRDAVSGNAGIVVRTTARSSVTLNVGRAFRMPNADEMFGETVTGKGVILGNPSIEPEYSWNIDLGYRGMYYGFEWDIALFANFYRDLISYEEYTESEDIDQIAVNRDKARIAGGELQLSYLMKDLFGSGHHIKPGTGFSHYRGDDWTERGSFWDIKETGEPLRGIPPARIKGFVRYIAIGECFNYFLELDADHSLKKYRVAEDETEGLDAYTLYGIKTGITLFEIWGLENIKFNIRVQNLLDERCYHYMSYIAVKGRNIKLFLSAEF